MRKDILIATNLSLIAGLGLSACKSIGARDFNPDSASNNPNSTEISPTMVPFPKIEPLNEKEIKVFLDNCQNCEELGITMETVTGGYFEGDFLFHSKDKNDADYFYLNQGTFFEPLNWESTDSEFALVPKANEGDIYTGLKYFIWNPNVTDDNGNMIVTYQPDGTPNSAQKFILPSNNDIEPRLKRARFIVPEISPQSLLPQEVKEKFELAGIDLTNMENAKYDKDGLHITLAGGEVIVLTNDQLAKGIYNGQDNVLQYRDETNQNVIYAFDKETGKWGEASLTIENLDAKKWGNYSLIENPDGYYEMKDVQGNLIPEVKLFRDGTAELTYSSKKLAVAFQAISVGAEGQLSFGLWDFKNGEWSMAPGYTAEDVRAGEFADDYHKLVVIRGNDEIEKKLTDTIFIARDLYMNNTEGYRPASEFEGITVTYNFKTVENFDVRPKEWIMQNFSRNFPGFGEEVAYKFKPISTNNEVGYQDGTNLSYARPMQVALGSGWFNLEFYNTDGAHQLNIIHVPIVAMNTDETLISLSSLVKLDDLDKITHLLTKNERGKFYTFFLLKKNIKSTPYTFADDELIQVMTKANQKYFEIESGPELDTSWNFNSLPKTLGQTFFLNYILPENQKK